MQKLNIVFNIDIKMITTDKENQRLGWKGFKKTVKSCFEIISGVCKKTRYLQK